MPGPFDLSPEVQMSEIMLEKMKVAARGQIGPQMAHDLEIRQWLEPMTDRLIYELRTRVYTHNVDRQDIVVPFDKTETHTIPAPRRFLWTYLPVALLGLVLTIAFESLPAFLMACATALVWMIVHAANPARKVDITTAGEVQIHREQFNAFPDNDTVYPDSLGGAVRMATANTDLRYYRQ